MSSGKKWELKKPLTVQELEAILEEDSDLDDINDIDAVYVPPPVDPVTDEEDLDEDCLVGENIAADIAGTFEIHTENLDEDDNFDEPTPGPSGSKKKKTSPKFKPKQYVPSWKKREPSYSSVPTTNEFQKIESIKQNIGGKSPLEVFLLFFDDTVLNTIADFSLKYAQDNNRHDFKFSVSLLKQFLGILILTGYHTLPACDLYWSKDADKGVDLVRSCMSRNTFRSIKRNLHLADNNTLDKTDKFSKLRPVFNLLNEKYLQFGIFTHNLSIDEQMVPYFGRHSAKMFIKGKPVRFGFKIWCLCSSGGYLYQFIPYGGADSKGIQQEHPLGTRVVLDLLSVVSDASHHKVYFDNFFSSYNLFSILKEKGFYFTGTVRENRLPNCPMKSSKILGKQKRGDFDFCFDESAEVTVTRWNDSSVVTVATNHGTIEPILKAKRYNRKLKKEEQVPQPNVINNYNMHMGGVDILDNAVSNYRIRVRGKKWWWPLFINLVDCTVANAWKIYNIANDSRLSQLEFRSFLVLSLIKSQTKTPSTQEEEESEELQQPLAPSTSWGRPSRGSLPSAIRYDEVGHLVIREEHGKRRRCRVCKTHTVYLCDKCKVHIHPNCFSEFHNKSA